MGKKQQEGTSPGLGTKVGRWRPPGKAPSKAAVTTDFRKVTGRPPQEGHPGSDGPLEVGGEAGHGVWTGEERGREDQGLGSAPWRRGDLPGSAHGQRPARGGLGAGQAWGGGRKEGWLDGRMNGREKEGGQTHGQVGRWMGGVYTERRGRVGGGRWGGGDGGREGGTGFWQLQSRPAKWSPGPETPGGGR